MILLVGGEKGGSGKSCLAQNLAVYLKQHFNTEVLLVDCDPQRTSSGWVQARNEQEELPPSIVCSFTVIFVMTCSAYKTASISWWLTVAGKIAKPCVQPWRWPPMR